MKEEIQFPCLMISNEGRIILATGTNGAQYLWGTLLVPKAQKAFQVVGDKSEFWEVASFRVMPKGARVVLEND